MNDYDIQLEAQRLTRADRIFGYVVTAMAFAAVILTSTVLVLLVI